MTNMKRLLHIYIIVEPILHQLRDNIYNVQRKRILIHYFIFICTFYYTIFHCRWKTTLLILTGLIFKSRKMSIIILNYSPSELLRSTLNLRLIIIVYNLCLQRSNVIPAFLYCPLRLCFLPYAPINEDKITKICFL